jgi:hypothetical protein
MERNPIIHSPAEALPAAGVAFRCQYGSVAQQKLDLLQLASRFMAYPERLTVVGNAARPLPMGKRFILVEDAEGDQARVLKIYQARMAIGNR